MITDYVTETSLDFDDIIIAVSSNTNMYLCKSPEGEWTIVQLSRSSIKREYKFNWLILTMDKKNNKITKYSHDEKSNPEFIIDFLENELNCNFSIDYEEFDWVSLIRTTS
jgi:hypothetical protein